jgi:hypothetical protein
MIDPLALKQSLYVKDLYKEMLEDYPLLCLYEDYVKGEHALKFATQKFRNVFGGLFKEFADNYCPRVIETLSAYTSVKEIEASDEAQSKVLEEMLESVRFDAMQIQVHEDAFKFGNSYLVAAETQGGTQRLYRQDPRLFRVLYDPENPEQILVAVKVWRTLQNSWRLNIWFTDDGGAAHCYRYATLPKGDFKIEDYTVPSSLSDYFPSTDNPIIPLGTGMPVFHIAHSPDTVGYGVSALRDVIPLQNALNKGCCDLLVGMEFYALPQRWATGIEGNWDEDGNPKPLAVGGADRLWWTENENANFGSFTAGSLDQYLGVLEGWRMEISRVSRIPPHHLFTNTGNYPSGEALKTAESPLLAKVAKLQTLWGNVWEDIGNYLLSVNGYADPSVEVCWRDVTPRSRKEEAEADNTEVDTAARKLTLGVTRAQVLGELGYDDQQVQDFLAEYTAQQDANLKRLEQEMALRSTNPFAAYKG